MLGIHILGREWWIPSTTAPIIRAVTSILNDSDDEPNAPKLHVNLLHPQRVPGLPPGVRHKDPSVSPEAGWRTVEAQACRRG
jgi:hypothetical protein